jgi:8-hydroxy-5-deazaflavin:NADPH oxidoreductase
MRIAVLGTGVSGRTVAVKLARVGHQVMIGSRRIRDEKTVEWMKGSGENVRCGTFADATRFGDIVFNCTAGIAGFQTLKLAGRENMKGKILIDVADPLDSLTGMPPNPADVQDNPGRKNAGRPLLRSRAGKALHKILREIIPFKKKRWGLH